MGESYVCLLLILACLECGTSHAHSFDEFVTCPTVQMTNYLIEAFKNPVVINHTRSHVVPPLKGNDLERLRTFLQAQMQTSSL